MRLVVVGRGDELTGFALAGVETAVCASADTAESLVSDLCGETAGTGLVVVTPWVARQAPRAIAAARRRNRPPVITILPDPTGTGD